MPAVSMSVVIDVLISLASFEFVMRPVLRPYRAFCDAGPDYFTRERIRQTSPVTIENATSAASGGRRRGAAVGAAEALPCCIAPPGAASSRRPNALQVSGPHRYAGAVPGEEMMLETTIAGSLPKPAWLAEPEKLWAAWRQEGDALLQAKRDAALVWLKEQEAAGIDVVSDGEQFRIHFVHGFLERIEGIDWQKKTRMGIRNDRYVVEVPTVTAPVRRPAPVHVEEARFVRAHTDKKLKFTLPGPMTISDTIADGHYGRRADMAMAFAAVLNQEARELEAAGVDVIQFDEPAFNVFMDEVREWGIEALHRAIEGLACTTAVHICYGYGIEANIRWKETLGAEWRQYEAIFPALNASHIDQVSLECANSHVPLSLLELLPDKDLLVGVIDVASTAIETPEEVAAVIRAALRHVDATRICPCTNCGLAPLSREVAVGKLKALGAGAALMRTELGG
jgi:5-methyltetrahydropteroyltriglutamate--homocysteine methyltransferase